MKRSFAFLSVLLAASALCGAESGYNFLKAFCKAYPAEEGIALTSKADASGRVLTLTVAPGKPFTSLYTYMDVTPGAKMALSYLYKLSDYAPGEKAAASIRINFLTADGKKQVGKPHIHDLTLRNSPEQYVKAGTVFTVPEGAARIQAVLLYLNRVAGKFEVTNVAVRPVSDKMPGELRSAYDRSKAFWSNWPRNPSISLQRSADRRTVTFTSAVPGDNAALYTYCELQKNVTYTISFALTADELTVQPGGSATISLDFQTKAGKPSGDAPVQWKLDLPAAGRTKEYSFEFTAPANSENARLHVLRLKGVGGKFTIRDLAVEPVIDSVTVAAATAAVTLDGKLDEALWSECGRIRTFYTFGSGQVMEAETEMYLAYDAENLYLGVRCFEPEMAKLSRKETGRDSPVWCDDSIEFFIASPNNRAMQLIFNTADAQFDGELAQRVPGDPWRCLPERNYQWRSRTALEKDHWTGELVLPFREFGIQPKPGQKWRVNFVRNRRIAGLRGGAAQWNRQAGELKNVDKFATLEFCDGFAVLTRYREEMLADPLKVERKVERFAELPRRESGRYRVNGCGGTYLLNFYSQKFQRENAATWPQRQAQLLEEMSDALDSPPIGYPWGVKIFGGQEKLVELLKKNHWGFGGTIHHSGQDRQAIREGAVLKVRANLVNAADPLLHKITMQWGEEHLKNNAWMIPYLSSVTSTDEPTNTIYEAYSKTKNTENAAALDRIDAEIKASHGFGKYGLFDNFAANDDPDAPFRRIAFLKYWNDKVIAFKQEERDLVKKYAPDALFLAVNAFNTVSTFRGIELIPNFARVSDIGCVDPYPTSTLAQCGRERALYHTGFSARMLKDMNGGKIASVYLQGFNYCGRAPTPDNLREWMSQALKNGADQIRWYTDGNLETAPGCHEEIMRLSRIVRKMKPLALPETSTVAVLYSYIAQWGKFDIEQNAEYSLYVILGEQLKSNFKFVSDVELDDDRAKAGDYRLIIAPNLKYLTRTTAEKLRKFVNGGGRLLILDPEAFAFANDGTALKEFRDELVGAPLPGAKSAKSILLNGKEVPVEAAFAVTAPADAKVFATYPDRTAAAYERRVGKGSVVYFAATPFLTAKVSAAPGEWRNYFGSEMRNAGETLDRPHWDFMLPAPETAKTK